MTNTAKQLWRCFVKKPDVWFFYTFLATSTLSIRKVLFFYPINNSFNEYTGAYIYLSDIFLFLTIISWLFILCNKYSYLSILKTRFSILRTKCSTWNIYPTYNKIQNVPRGTFSCTKKVYQQLINNYILVFPFLLVAFSFISITWSANENVALYRSIKLFEFVLLFYYTYKMFHVEHFSEQQKNVDCSTPAPYNVPRGTFLLGWNNFKIPILIIIASGFIQSIIGIMQFILQHSIGLFWLKESIISQQLPGVAKVIFDGHAYIRAYGLFPHPNILGGFLVLSIILTLSYLKLFHACPVAENCSTWNNSFASGVEQFDEQQKNVNCSTPAPYNVPRGTFLLGWNNLVAEIYRIVPRGTFLLRAIVLIQAITLSLTFSKSAIIGLFIAFLYLLFVKCSKPAPYNVPRGTFLLGWNILPKNNTSEIVPRGTIWWQRFIELFHVEHFYKKLFLLAGIIILFFIILRPDIYSLFFKSLHERELYLNVSRGTILSNPFFGNGAGQFVTNMQNIANLESWQFQPVHNVFLLLLSDYGFFALFGFFYFIYKMFHVEHFGEKNMQNCSTPAPCNVPRGTFLPGWNILSKNNTSEIVPRGTICKQLGTTANTYFKSIFVAFLFIMLFDHYFWDIQQGQLLLWLIFALIIKSNNSPDYY